MKNYIPKRVYIAVDMGRIKEDAKSICKRQHKTSLSRELVIGGISDSVFSNAIWNYEFHKEEIDGEYAIPDSVVAVGRIDESRYLKLLDIFKMHDKYRLPAIGEVVEEAEEVIEVKPDNNTLIEALADMKAEIKNINLAIDNLAYAVLQIAEKMPMSRVKPVASLEPREEVKNIG